MNIEWLWFILIIMVLMVKFEFIDSPQFSSQWSQIREARIKFMNLTLSHCMSIYSSGSWYDTQVLLIISLLFFKCIMLFLKSLEPPQTCVDKTLVCRCLGHAWNSTLSVKCTIDFYRTICLFKLLVVQFVIMSHTLRDNIGP